MATKSKFYADLGLESASNLQVDGNATITGNLTVNGTTVTVNSSQTSVADSMLELATAQNPLGISVWLTIPFRIIGPLAKWPNRPTNSKAFDRWAS